MSILRRQAENKPDDVVFLLSPTGRSGTVYMLNVLTSYGPFSRPKNEILGTEDWLTSESQLLVDYVAATSEHWSYLRSGTEENRQSLESEILRAVGEALIRTACAGMSGKTVITRTPSAKGAANFRKLFGDRKVILLVRDGRDTCESLVRSGFVHNYEEGFARWAEQLQSLLDAFGVPDFDTTVGNHIWVKYEDAVNHPTATFGRLSRFLNVRMRDATRHEIEKLPVYGSSEFGQTKGEQFEWHLEPRTRDFNPFQRWIDWPEKLRAQFERAAGQQQSALGYEMRDGWK